MTIQDLIAWVTTHQTDIAAWVTFAMLSIIAASHALVGFARGCVWVAGQTTSTADDEPARALLAFARDLDRRVQALRALHSRLFPGPLNPTPASDAAGITSPETPSTRSSR